MLVKHNIFLLIQVFRNIGESGHCFPSNYIIFEDYSYISRENGFLYMFYFVWILNCNSKQEKCDFACDFNERWIRMIGG